MNGQPYSSVIRLFKNYPRVFKLIWATSPFDSTVAIGLTLCSAIVLPAQIWISKLIIDRVAAMAQGPASTAPIDWYAALTPVAILAFVWIFGIVCETLCNEVKALLSIQVRHHTEYLILQKATRLDIAFFESSAFYDQMDLVLREGYRAHNLAYISLNVLGSFVGLGALLALLVQLHPLAVLVLLLTSAPRALITGRHANAFYQFNTERAAAGRMANYLAGLISSREAVKEIRLWGLGQHFLERFHQHFRAFFDAERKIRTARDAATIALSAVSIIGTAGIWVYAIVQAILMRTSLGDVALVLQAAEQSRSRLQTLFFQAGEIYENSLYTDNLFSFLDLPADSVAGALPRPRTQDKPLVTVARPMRQGIEFRNVSFRYPGSDRDVLKHFSCILHPGTTTALVGANGAGKTTLSKLLSRFYDPTEGHILLDGKDLREYDLENLRSQMGVIFQDFVRFDLSVRENIALGQIDRADDLQRVKKAAELGGAQSIIAKLPQQYDNIIGKRFAGGIDLSGGEWQKIALSRAFMRDAQILILDEPTAALDAMAEYEIYRRFAELTADKTTLFISHRFSTVRMADHILVLEDGVLKEAGDHNELMAAKGHYAEMFNIQAERYQ